MLSKEELAATQPAPCRCGHTGDGPHPCHGRAYTCRRPAQERFYALHMTALAGAQMKLGASETWARDECWAEYRGGGR